MALCSKCAGSFYPISFCVSSHSVGGRRPSTSTCLSREMPSALLLAMLAAAPEPQPQRRWRELSAAEAARPGNATARNITLCDNTCKWSYDGERHGHKICDDGHFDDASYPAVSAYCNIGTDCADCGPRVLDMPQCDCCAVMFMRCWHVVFHIGNCFDAFARFRK